MIARAAVFDGPGKPFRLVEVPLPPPGPGECLVHVTLATVCGSDLHTIAGKRDGKVPCVLGHEAVGVVEAVGGGVTTVDGEAVNVGDRVVWSVAASCGRCFFCERELPQKCDGLRKYGKEPFDPAWGPTGTLASHVRLWPGSAVVKVPDDLPDAVASPAMCATATVAAAIAAAPPGAESAVVMGCGMLGLTATAMLSAAGVRVTAIDSDPARLSAVTHFGAEFRKPRSPGADVAFEFTGDPGATRMALHSVRTGGAIILVGAVFPAGSLNLTGDEIVRNCWTIRGVHNYAPQDLLTALRFLADNHSRYPFAALVERTFPLDEIDAAVAYTHDRRPVRVGIRPVSG